MNYSFDKLAREASEKFPMFNLTYIEVRYQGTLPVFIAKVNCDEHELEKNWQHLVHYIAFNFQSQISDEFSVWNIYIFFINDGPVGSVLKYKIENDTFSSRKIVIEENLSQEEILTQHITNQDVNFLVENLTVTAFPVFDLTIGKYVSKSTTSKRLTEEHRGSLKSIIKEIKGSMKNEI